MSPVIFPSFPRPNWIEINLDAFINNLQQIRQQIPPDTQILLPVKADAYGHGSLACSYTALQAGVDWLGVAHAFEGILLRQYGVRLPILILGTTEPEGFEYLIQYQLTPTFSEPQAALTFNQWLKDQQISWNAHLKIDTGMHRFGISWNDEKTLLQMLHLSHVTMSGAFSHLANADDDAHPATQEQISRFQQFMDLAQQHGLRPSLCHLGNSAAVWHHPEACFDMVRPGIAAYGYNPLNGTKPSNLQPILSMHATIRQIRELPPGESVSYGHLYTTTQPTRIATVAIGYGDGYLRGRPNEGEMWVRGKSCPIVGRVCMDATMIDITEVPEAQVGDVVQVIDGRVDSRISMEALAQRHQTISYEITSRMARRLYRRYRYQGQMICWDELKPLLKIPAFEEYPQDLFPNHQD